MIAAMRWVAFVMVAGVAAAGTPKPPHGAKHIAIDYTHTSFQHHEHHYVLDWRDGAYHTDTRTVDASLVAALYGTLAHAQPAAERLTCISHTDDYPDFAIVVDGDQPLALESKSNCHDHVPWNLTANGKLLVQFDAAAGRAVADLLVAIDFDTWKDAFRDAPFGMERVVLGDYSAGKPATSAAAATCARAFESDKRAKKLFGDPLRVTSLQLGCDLAQSSDCSAPAASATFLWEGVEARVEVPCAKGTIDISADLADTFAKLRAFVASKPMRTLVKLAKAPPRLFDNRRWTAMALDRDLPELDLVPGSALIEARSTGDKGASAVPFWSALGLDPKPLTQSIGNGFGYQTQATLDVDGHVVK
jgi:hypothetical protein